MGSHPRGEGWPCGGSAVGVVGSTRMTRTWLHKAVPTSWRSAQKYNHRKDISEQVVPQYIWQQGKKDTPFLTQRASGAKQSTFKQPAGLWQIECAQVVGTANEQCHMVHVMPSLFLTKFLCTSQYHFFFQKVHFPKRAGYEVKETHLECLFCNVGHWVPDRNRRLCGWSTAPITMNLHNPVVPSALSTPHPRKKRRPPRWATTSENSQSSFEMADSESVLPIEQDVTEMSLVWISTRTISWCRQHEQIGYVHQCMFTSTMQQFPMPHTIHSQLPTIFDNPPNGHFCERKYWACGFLFGAFG